MWLTVLLLGLRVPMPPASLLQPAPHSVSAMHTAARRMPVMLAKKKAKPNKAAAKALEALEQWESNLGPGSSDDDGLAPVSGKQPKKAKKKSKKMGELSAEAEAALAAADAGELPDALRPVTPEPLKKRKKAVLAEAEAALPPPPVLTMAQKVEAVAAELGLDMGMPMAASVKAANEALGLEASGTIAQQVEVLREQLGLVDAPLAAPPPPPPPDPPPSPPPPVEAAAPVADVAAPAESEGTDAEGIPESAAANVGGLEVPPETAPAANEAAEEAAAGEAGEVRLSKKKQGKKKKADGVEDGEAEPSGGGSERDQSGRRGMTTRVDTAFADAAPGFARVQIVGGKLRFRNQEVLVDANWAAETGERVGLVGNNGAGKTTQLRILAGEVELDDGELVKSRSDVEVTMLRQEFREELRETRTLKEELLSVFGEVLELQRQYAESETALAEAGDDADAMQQALDSMSELQSALDMAGGSTVSVKADRMISAMGFAPSDADLPVSAFSGGWKMRIGLGKCLLQEPQVLLLDEPTNHMDLESTEWLERYLVESTEKLAIVVVSHDREFLDRVCTKIVETEFGVTYSYKGNYRSYLTQKQARVAQAMQVWEAQQKEIKGLREDINRLRRDESAAAAVRSRERQLKAMLEGGEDHVPRPYTESKRFSFRFPPAPRCSKEVIEFEEVGHGYGDSTLFSGVDLCIERGDRIAILGANGAGKSTLLRLLLGNEKPRHGRAEIVANNAVVQYFEQDQANALPLDKTALQALESTASSTSYVYEQLRALLGKFMFKGEKVTDKIALLSGGEKARLALCQMMITPANLLVLDEPTNHLDITAKEVLEEALQHFEGTVVMSTHDRFFVSQTATTILALEKGELVVYDGDYRSYMEQNQGIADKVQGRYIEGLPTIQSAPKIELQPDDDRKAQKKKKNFGGKGGPSGNKMKGVKNAKRQAAFQ